MEFPINEYFFSVQGEGRWSGLPAFFIRFGRCNLRCSFCDTKKAFKEYDFFSLKEIEEIIKRKVKNTDHIILTGGEPLLYDLSRLVDFLKKKKFRIHVETNGTIWQEWLREIDWVTVSPKRERPPDEKVLKLASELKVVIQNRRDILFAERFSSFSPVYLMPESNHAKKAVMIMKYLQSSSFSKKMFLGIQMQKQFPIQ